METIIIKPSSAAKSKLVLDFLKKEKISAKVYKEPTKDEILEGIEAGAKEVKLYMAGKIKLKDAQQLLDEL
jgi:hypothetical protein